MGSVQPGPDAEPTIDLIVKDVQAYFGTSQAAVLAMSNFYARKAMGMKKYGVVHNVDIPRDHILDALEEALDLTVYLRAAIKENPLFFEVLYDDYMAALNLSVKLGEIHSTLRSLR